MQARLLCIALVQTFCAGSEAALSKVSSRLGDPTRWAVDDTLMLVASGVMGMALGTASAGPGSPRRASNSGAAPEWLSNMEPQGAGEYAGSSPI